MTWGNIDRYWSGGQNWSQYPFTQPVLNSRQNQMGGTIIGEPSWATYSYGDSGTQASDWHRVSGQNVLVQPGDMVLETGASQNADEGSFRDIYGDALSIVNEMYALGVPQGPMTAAEALQGDSWNRA
ncbi:MAG: hypothetical protein SFZ03_07260 [Candidatus Melainabacteria bacterium]|nr:hypothetical protein [Candidatus Melainabacteria bacterium]